MCRLDNAGCGSSRGGHTPPLNSPRWLSFEHEGDLYGLLALLVADFHLLVPPSPAV